MFISGAWRDKKEGRILLDEVNHQQRNTPYRDLPGQVSRGHPVSRQRPGYPADLLRLPGRALAAYPHLTAVIEGVPFKDGCRVDDNTDVTQVQDAA